MMPAKGFKAHLLHQPFSGTNSRHALLFRRPSARCGGSRARPPRRTGSAAAGCRSRSAVPTSRRPTSSRPRRARKAMWGRGRRWSATRVKQNRARTTHEDKTVDEERERGRERHRAMAAAGAAEWHLHHAFSLIGSNMPSPVQIPTLANGTGWMRPFML